MRVLLGENPTVTGVSQDRAKSPQWHRAIRLYAQRVLEQSATGSDDWRSSVERLDEGAEAGALMRDLFLEALFLATNASELLEKTWDVLIANNGQLLNRLLDRFLFVATVPDPRLIQITDSAEDAARLEYAFRVPFWPYWGPVLTTLRAHLSEVVQFAPHYASKISALWLRSLPVGPRIPWRKEAAELAIAVAQESQARNAEDRYSSHSGDSITYEALLYAAADFPDEVGELCLELGQRRELPESVRLRAEQARQRKQEERRKWEEANPGSREAIPMFGRLRGSRPAPWPDGPRASVERAFQEACLESGAFPVLVRANPHIAVEVLLAVCIEAPQEEHFLGGSSLEDCGVVDWHAGEPPMYFRGPFLQLLRIAPENGLTFILRLINFATSRYVRDGRGLEFVIAGEPKCWLGDSGAFRWHHDWPLSNGALIQSGLMALEKWFYEQIEQDLSVDAWTARIVVESRSTAFAGLLLDVGKRVPALLAGPLAPLLQSWELFEWDRQITHQRQAGMGGPNYWGLKSPRLIQLAQDWYGLPHRRQALTGHVIRTMVTRKEAWPLLRELRAKWSPFLTSDDDSTSLRQLIEQLDPANYTFEQRGEELVPVAFRMPEELARENAEKLRQLNQQMTLTRLPLQCRKLLDEHTPLSTENVAALWQYLQEIDVDRPDALDSDEPIMHLEDAICGGIAVLLCLHGDWCYEDASRISWCRKKLEGVLQYPPPSLRFDSPITVVTYRWDAFAAQAGVQLLIRDRDDPLARKLVAGGVLGYHYNITKLTMSAAFKCRGVLGDDFDRLIGLSILWAGLRASSVAVSVPSLAIERKRWLKRQQALVSKFVSRTLPPSYPGLRTINEEALAEREALYEKQFPEHSKRKRKASAEVSDPLPKKVHPHRLGLDAHVITAAFDWLDLGNASSDDERRKWLGLVRSFLDISLAQIPAIEDPGEPEIDGLPDNLDTWLYRLVAQTISRLTLSEDPKSLWQPILDLGGPANKWVERLFWYWFTDGFSSAKSPTDFVRIWSAMIEYALSSPKWNPAIGKRYYVDAMVFHLLGFDLRFGGLACNGDAAAAVGSMEALFARSAQAWFGLPRVVNGFAAFAVQPAAARLLIPGISWIQDAVAPFDSYDWKYGLEENVIEFLHVCWERERQRLSSDPIPRDAFLKLLATVVSRGKHAAIALRDRVVASLAG